MKGKKLQLDCTTSGHYRLPLQDHTEMMERMEEIMMTLGENDKEKYKKIKKLHHQFGHPSSKRLRLLLRDAGVEDPESHTLVEKVANGCETCLKFRRTPSRPK